MKKHRCQVHQQMDWLSRAVHRICKANRWRNDSVRIPHTSWPKNERDRARDRWVYSTRSTRRWRHLHSRNQSSSSIHGGDDRNSDFFKGTERRKHDISGRRGKKCSWKLKRRYFLYIGPGSERDLELRKSIQMTPKGKSDQLADQVADVYLVQVHIQSWHVSISRMCHAMTLSF